MKLIKESVIKILEILSTADPVRDAVTVEGESIPCQYVIDSLEVKECKALLARLIEVKESNSKRGNN